MNIGHFCYTLRTPGCLTKVQVMMA